MNCPKCGEGAVAKKLRQRLNPTDYPLCTTNLPMNVALIFLGQYSSGDTYRKNPTELTVWCDACGHSFGASQSLKPILITKAYSQSPPRGIHTVKVWYCPVNTSKYSFSISYGTGIARFGEFDSDPYRSGMFDTPQLAMEAGIRWVRGETHD